LRRPGRLNPEAVRAGLRAITERHDALRIGFRPVEGKIRAYNRPAGEREEFLLNVSEHEEITPGMLRAAANDAHRSLDIENGPMVAAALLTSDAESVLVIAIHHL